MVVGAPFAPWQFVVMTPASDELPLAAEFPAATREQWRKLVEGVLKGAPFDKKLVARSYDGLAIEPLYDRKADALPIAGRAPGTPWSTVQRVDHPDPSAANAEALHDLENGATGLSLVFAGGVGAYGYGLPASDEAVTRALTGVHLDAGIGLDLDLGSHDANAADWLAASVERHGLAPAATGIRFGLDPIGAAAISGGSRLPWSGLAPGLHTAISALADRGFGGPFACADGRIIHNAGGSEAQELAYVLAVAVAYLRALEAGGNALEAARRMIYFRLSADADEFLTIAKLRALRKLWARIEEACGLEPAPCFVAAETAWRMMTRSDPYVNMLRTTIAVVAAGLGGADAITALPFTMALGLPDRFARRIARNTQLILLEESNLWRVADPAAGSGGFEALTEALGEKAWTLFQELEGEGGIVASLAAGALQARIAAVRTERERAVATRREPITGTSAFPNLSEAEVKVLLPRLSEGQRPGPRSGPGEGRGGALPSLRAAEPYERLREASDALLARTGARPKIFLANLGPPAAFTARAGFARNLFEAGGVEAVTNEGFADPAALAEAFRASGAKAACLCSSDAIYASHAADAARALKGAGCARVFLAGRPGEHETGLRQAGIDDFVHAGSDVVAFLQSFYKEDLR